MSAFRDAIAARLVGEPIVRVDLALADSESRHLADFVLATPEMESIRKFISEAGYYAAYHQSVSVDAALVKEGLPESVIEWVLDGES